MVSNMPNIIVGCIGGLGNQMFQYAYFLRLNENYQNMYFDISNFANYKLHNGYELERIFSIQTVTPPQHLLKNFKTGFLAKLLSKFELNNKHIIQNNMHFDIKYLHIKHDCYLSGYWQSEKYFKTISNKIKQAFTFGTLDNANSKIAKQIKYTNSVSIHIRRGDYVNHPKHGEICTLNYYHNAINLIKSIVDNPIFYVFSDDIQWCQTNLFPDGIAVYVNGNDWKNSYKDMHLMSLCKHNIIANSSFSWWGAWLNTNEDKTVIAPKIWFNDPSIDTKDLTPINWIKL
jgi:hypothetical protein